MRSNLAPAKENVSSAEKDHKILTQNKRKLATRLKRKNYSDQAEPMFQPGNLHYEMAERLALGASARCTPW